MNDQVRKLSDHAHLQDAADEQDRRRHQDNVERCLGDARKVDAAHCPWQPIETAPKDGTEILCSTKNGNMYVVSYDGIFASPWRIINEFGLHAHAPVHWMPLPPLPAA